MITSVRVLDDRTEPLSEAIRVRLTAQQREEVDKIALAEDSDRSKVIREALDDLFERRRQRAQTSRDLRNYLGEEVHDILADLPGGDTPEQLACCVINEHRRCYPRRAKIRMPAFGARACVTADDLIDEVLITPHVDYLVTGMCLGNASDDIAEWLDGLDSVGNGPKDVFGNARYTFQRNKLFADGVKVGQIAWSQGSSTDYGRNLLFHFTGSAFRGDGRGADLTPGQCFAWMTETLRGALEGAGRGIEDCHFATINRVDYVSQVKLKDGVTAADLRALPLPDGYAWAETNASHTGTTHYASSRQSARGNAGEVPLIRVYDKTTDEHCPEGEARIEVQIPRVRMPSGRMKSFGVLGAAEIAAEVFGTLLPSDAPAEVVSLPSDETYDDPARLMAHRHTPGVHVLDTRGMAFAEELNRRRFSGHNTRTMKRLGRQFLTLGRRAFASYCTAHIAIRGAGINPDGPPDVPDEFGVDIYGGADFPPEAVHELFADPRHSLRDLVADEPFPIEEIDELQSLLDHYRELCFPNAPRTKFEGYAERTTWLERMTAPIEHEPLRTYAKVRLESDRVEVWDRTGTRLTHIQYVDWMDPRTWSAAPSWLDRNRERKASAEPHEI